MKEYNLDEYASDEDKIVTDEEHHVSVDSSLSDEEVDTKEKFIDTLKSKDDKLTWQKKPYQSAGRFQSSNILNLTSSPTQFSITRIEYKYCAFELLFPHNLKTMIVNCTHLEGKSI